MAITYDAMGNVTGSEYTAEEQRKDQMGTPEGKAKLYAQTKAYQQGKMTDPAQIRDMQENLLALGAKVETRSGPNGASTEITPIKVNGKKDEITNTIVASYSQSYEAANNIKAGGPAAAKLPDAKAPAATAAAPAAKPMSADGLKQQEAEAYLRVLGKTYDQFKAENAIAGGADLANKGATSPEALAALKAKMVGSPEAQEFARKMLEKSATQDRAPGLKNADLKGADVVALQYALKANGKDIGSFGQSKDGVDGVLGRMTREAAQNLIVPSRDVKVGGPSKAPNSAPPASDTLADKLKKFESTLSLEQWEAYKKATSPSYETGHPPKGYDPQRDGPWGAAIIRHDKTPEQRQGDWQRFEETLNGDQKKTFDDVKDKVLPDRLKGTGSERLLRVDGDSQPARTAQTADPDRGGRSPGQQVINNPQGPQIVYVEAPQGIRLGQPTIAPYYNQQSRMGQTPEARAGYDYAQPMTRQEQAMAAREAAMERRQDRVWARQDYIYDRNAARQDQIQERREVAQQSRELATGIGQLTDRNRHNDGQGIANVAAPLLANIFRPRP